MWWSREPRGRWQSEATSAGAAWAHRGGAWVGALVGCAMVTGCFGKVADSRESEEQELDRTVTSITQDDGVAAAEPGAGDEFPWDPKLLDACTDDYQASYGFTPATANGRSCNWMAGGLCYEQKDPACSCACGTEYSLCLSDFPEEGGGVEVWCD